MRRERPFRRRRPDPDLLRDTFWLSMHNLTNNYNMNKDSKGCTSTFFLALFARQNFPC